MKQINSQYDQEFERLKNVFKDKSGKGTYTDENPVSEAPEEFRNIMNIVLTMYKVKMQFIGC